VLEPAAASNVFVELVVIAPMSSIMQSGELELPVGVVRGAWVLLEHKMRSGELSSLIGIVRGAWVLLEHKGGGGDIMLGTASSTWNGVALD
jgi:hypothetical protein